ncbi:MAG: right-handed parallel beta-helix repeat-containing protein, partial [Candidatus Methylomirabilota bacterium]
DDGADHIEGGPGREWILGNGGNDWISGGSDDDIVEGGAGDDTIFGDAGGDLIVGGADHDTIYGHSASGADDDLAVDYLYGDFGTDGGEAGAGRDRLYGQGGNDLLFGEGEDDFLDAGAGGSNLVSYGTGESAAPSDFAAPSPTADPAVVESLADPAATDTLPQGPVYRGWWGEIAGSATGTGLTGGLGLAEDPAVATDAAGVRYIAWADGRNGNLEIYVARQTGTGWEMLGGSAQGGGVSASAASSLRPSLALDAGGAPVVAWVETLGGTADIRAARFDAGSGGWVALGDSLSAAGISGSGHADQPAVISTTGGMVVAWLDRTSGVMQVHAKRFDGTGWVALGAEALTDPVRGVFEFSLAADGAKIAVAWSQPRGTQSEIYAKEFDGTTWTSLVGADPDAGVSGTPRESREPAVAYLGGQLFVAWRDASDGLGQIYAARFTGTDWIEAGAGAAQGTGISASAERPTAPQLAAGGGKLYLAWADQSALDAPASTTALRVKLWNGTAFVEELPGDAAGDGIDRAAGLTGAVALTVDSTGRPTVAWSDAGSGRSQVYLRTVTQQIARTFTATPETGVQAILDANDLGAGDAVLLLPGLYEGFTLSADDAGVLILGAPGGTSRVDGPITVGAGAGGALQRLLVTGLLTETGSVGLTVAGCTLADGLILGGGTDLQIVQNHITGIGLRVTAASQGLITGNDMEAAAVLLELAAPFVGPIQGNAIHGGTTGVQYDAPATLIGNRIFGNTVGVRSTVAGADGFGFLGALPLVGVVEGRLQNEISGNGTGVLLVNASLQAQWIHDNATGVSGSGTVGGNDFAHANLIEGNSTGVSVAGTIQWNRIADNTIGIAAASDTTIVHNLIYGNAAQGVLVSGKTDVRIFGNTVYAPTGDNIRVQSASSEVEVQNNILWAMGGYDLFVANDSRSGFWSDYNTLFTSGSGTLGFFTKEFTDLLDWQTDLNKFDLHSVGVTAVNPVWAEPRFAGLLGDDFRLLEPAGRQRFANPAVDAGNILADIGRPSSHVNLLANPGFESGLTGWVTSAGASVKTASPAPYDGTGYFFAGAVQAGFASQAFTLADLGYTPAELDARDLEILFGGRIRTMAESPADRGEVQLIFRDGSGTTLATAAAQSTRAADRWELVGQRADIPIGTRTIEFVYRTNREAGSNADAYFDQGFLSIVSENAGSDQGAYGHAATDPDLAGTPRIDLRFPDLYVDWEKHEPMDIRWETFGNTDDSTVRIDLYRDGPDGPAFVAVIAAGAPDSGQYTWTPDAQSVAFGTPGLRIQVSLTQNPLALDRSQEP